MADVNDRLLFSKEKMIIQDLVKNKINVDLRIKELLNTNTPTADQVFSILTPERQKKIRDNNWH